MIKGQVAVVTGASSGIGYATSLAIAKAGAKVAVAPAKFTVRGGTVKLTAGAVVLGVAPVVKLQTKPLASALPARYLAPVVIVAV